MEISAISEKNFELLFSHYWLRSFGMRELTLYAPSSRAEYLKGYDAMFYGTPQCRELYIQFKKPQYLKRDDSLEISITPHQHKRLLSHPRSSAYYVAHTFQSIGEINEVQSNIKSSKEFLRWFIAISAHAIPEGMERVSYNRSPISGMPTGPSYRTEKATTRLLKSKTEWFTGLLFADYFSDGSIGCDVALIAPPEAQRPENQEIAQDASHLRGVSNPQGGIWKPTFDYLEAHAQPDEEGSYGCCIRRL